MVADCFGLFDGVHVKIPLQVATCLLCGQLWSIIGQLWNAFVVLQQQVFV